MHPAVGDLRLTGVPIRPAAVPSMPSVPLLLRCL
jgi:hypothetical protein